MTQTLEMTPPTLKPLLALRALRQLVRNKDDTKQVFLILKSLGGGSSFRGFQRFRATKYGQQVLATQQDLVDLLSNRHYLESLPEGSLGRAFIAFMDRCGLSPEGLADASREAGIDEASFTPEFRKFEKRLRCSHDLWHVVTGYGCDGLGEMGLVAFSYRHIRNIGFMLIAVAAAYNYKKQFPDRPIWRIMWEGYRRGGTSSWLVLADWERLLPLPLNQVRRQLNIPEAPIYQGVPDVINATLTASPLAA